MALSILKALLWKNFLIFKTHKNKYLLIYVSPLLVLLLLMILQKWTEQNFTWENLNPPEYNLNPVPRCNGQNCLTLGIIYEGQKQPYMDSVISYLRTANQLDESDIQQMNIEAKDVMNYLRKNPNKTQSILVFCSNSSWRVGEIQVPCWGQHFHLNFYVLIYNLSLFHRVPYMGNLKQSYPKDLVTLKLKYDIDSAIISHYKPGTKLNLTFADYPSRTSRFVNGISIIGQYGSFFIMLPYLALLVMQGSRLLVQKQKRLRIGLNIVGVTHLQFYLAQILTYFTHVLIISTTFCISGYALNFKFWSKGIIIFDFAILSTNGFVLGLLVLCVTAGVAERGLGMSVLYGFVLYSVVMQWLFTGGFLFDMLYFTNASNVVVFLRYLFNAYPSFHFSKLFSDISRKADNHVDTFQNRYVQGTQFTWDDIFVRQSKSYQKPFPQTYVLPSPLQSAIYLLATSLIFLVALWLLDQLVQSNRGYRQNLISCLKKKRKMSLQYDRQLGDQLLVQITNLQKIYDNKIFALTGITANLKRGEIVALLGQNGAGKSTLINILIGALSKTRGEAFIDDISVDQDIQAIRKTIGVCPQFDILWEQLTAGQHIQLFHRLKGLQIDNERILKCLQSVSLQKNVNGRVCTFSGGMRRRLSLSLSLIGNPKFVILDQPTTGMDAKVRLLTWKLILQLRMQHTVLITTHNMEEAQCVADRIMIMAKGRVIAEGTALELKKSYGQGYIIRGFDRVKKQDVVLRCKDSEFQKMLMELEKGDIENWSLHETTLEEVFLNVANRF